MCCLTVILETSVYYSQNVHLSKNQAFLGSGLAVQVQGEISKVTDGIQVTIADTVFKKNGCDENGDKAKARSWRWGIPHV